MSDIARRRITRGVVIATGVVIAAACGSSTKHVVGASGATTSTPTSYNAPTPTTAAIDLHLTSAGTVNGVSFSGDVTPTQLNCDTATASYTSVRWAGDVTANGKAESLVGDMTLKTGAQQLNGSEASLVLGGDYKNRIGSAKGTATVAADGKSGTIDAQLSSGSDHATLKGDWKCS